MFANCLPTPASEFSCNTSSIHAYFRIRVRPFVLSQGPSFPRPDPPAPSSSLQSPSSVTVVARPFGFRCFNPRPGRPLVHVFLLTILPILDDDDGNASFDSTKLSRHHSHSLNGTDAAIMHLAPPPLEAVGSDFNTIQSSADHNRNSVSRQSLMGKRRHKAVLIVFLPLVVFVVAVVAPNCWCIGWVRDVICCSWSSFFVVMLCILPYFIADVERIRSLPVMFFFLSSQISRSLLTPTQR